MIKLIDFKTGPNRIIQMALRDIDMEDLADAMQVSDPRLRNAVRAYEDGLLGRLAGDPRFEAASDALARLPDDCRAEGVAVLVEQLLSHILYIPPERIQRQLDFSSPVDIRIILGRDFQPCHR